MSQKTKGTVAALGWQELEDALRAPARGAAGATQQSLRDYFGDDEVKVLRQFAEHARVQRSATKLGNVVLLPGIMGSILTTVDAEGDQELVWINYLRIIKGRVERLKLSPDGMAEADPGFKVVPTDVDKHTYARAVLWLRARWSVEPFPFDWRKDLDASANALAAFIRQKFPDQPVHLVAHSMGGLVSRNFIRLYPKLWREMRDSTGCRGGRLVMLGTPNYGSFAIPRALTGEEKLVKLLEIADVYHDLKGIIEILDSFVGSYQMLPAPRRAPSADRLYRSESWGAAPVLARHLQRAYQFQNDIERGDTIDPERMFYIAGCGQETLSEVNIRAPGDFLYSTTFDGDGRVPHSLGLLDGVATYYVREVHGDLPRNEQVLAAIDDLLAAGTTAALSQQPIPSRAVSRGVGPWRPHAVDETQQRDFRAVAERADKGVAGAEELRRVEEGLRRAAAGRSEAPVRPPTEGRTTEKPAARHQLLVELVCGDVACVDAPVIVVGHYNGVAPVRAEGAVDKALGFWISRAGERGMIGANLGQLFFIPAASTRLPAKAVVLAGMGDAGHFRREDLRYLASNVTFGIAALGHDRFASVLVGSGGGGLRPEDALRAYLQGVADAVQHLAPKTRLKRLTLVEKDEEAANRLHQLLRQLEENQGIPGLKLTVRLGRPLPSPKTRSQRDWRPPDVASNPLRGLRLTIERKDDTFRFSALTEAAVVPVRDVKVQSFFAQEAAAHLIAADRLDEQVKYGRLLATYLLPEDFQGCIEDGPLTLIIDRDSAAFPWEMGCLHTNAGDRWLGVDLNLTRQFRTLLARAPGVAPPINRKLKVLVIADPAPEQKLSLPGARAEGHAVVSVVKSFAKSLGIELISRIGPSECDPVEILAMILDYDFDILHFAGHGIFDNDRPESGGWVFGENCILTAREIFRARRVPRLVFANACFSAVVQQRSALTADELNRGLASLAEAFFERGVHNYIGAGWPVADDQAVTFASEFYKLCLQAGELGDCVAEARRKIQGVGNTWGAYQHYGQVDDKLLAPDADSSAARAVPEQKHRKTARSYRRFHRGVPQGKR